MHDAPELCGHAKVNGLTPGVMSGTLGPATALLAAVLDATLEFARDLVCAVLVHVAADPYAADELDDPFFASEDYELAREVLAIERLITGRLGGVLRPARVLRLFGGVELPTGLAHCTAALREMPDGDTVYLCFELDLAAPSSGLAAEVVRVSGSAHGSPWEKFESTPHADATLALIDFYSDRAPQPGRADR